MRISDWSSTCALPISLPHCSMTVASPSPPLISGYPLNRRVHSDPYHEQLLPEVKLRESTSIVHDVEIGRASCRERVCQSVSISVVAVALKKKTQKERAEMSRDRQQIPKQKRL